MRKVEEYMKHADECRQLAASASNEENRRQLLEMVETWKSLARDRNDQIARQARISAFENSGNGAEN